MERSSLKRPGSPAIATVLCLTAALLCGGCKEVGDFFKTDATRFFSPDKVVAAPERPAINPILPSVGMGDQHEELVPNATFPRPGDWSYKEEDYVLGPTDIVDIAVMDLFQPGAETVLRRQVSDTGYIDLPLLPSMVRAKGLNKEQLKAAIADEYRKADVLREAIVSVTILAFRQSTFSILGAIGRPGTYAVTRKDMRLLEALAAAGGLSQASIRYIYVIRPAPAVAERAEAQKPAEAKPPSPEAPAPLPEIPTKVEPETVPATKPATEPAETTDVEELLRELGRGLPGSAPASQPGASPGLAEVLQLTETATTGPGTSAPARGGDAAKRSKWIYSGGRWIQVEEEAPPAVKPSGEETPPVRPVIKPPTTREAVAVRAEEEPRDPYRWREIERTDLARIIAVNLSKLQAGDPRMNIVMRDNDIIQVPTLEIGEFYIGGEVQRPGVYSLTGRQVTVKQAVTAAGNLAPLSWPENSILVRRIGDFQEQVMALDIEAIFKGEEPDIYLRPNDMIVVGTDVRAPFWAVMRNAFRMTYGFGFIWDRNFAEPLMGGFTSNRFTRW
jgi:protein involved in polysaccharide export with SLBB domain